MKGGLAQNIVDKSYMGTKAEGVKNLQNFADVIYGCIYPSLFLPRHGLKPQTKFVFTPRPTFILPFLSPPKGDLDWGVDRRVWWALISLINTRESNNVIQRREIKKRGGVGWKEGPG